MSCWGRERVSSLSISLFSHSLSLPSTFLTFFLLSFLPSFLPFFLPFFFFFSRKLHHRRQTAAIIIGLQNPQGFKMRPSNYFAFKFFLFAKLFFSFPSLLTSLPPPLSFFPPPFLQIKCGKHKKI